MRMRIGNQVLTLEVTNENKIKVLFGYNKKLVEQIKAMGGARPHYEGKQFKYWTIDASTRNTIALKRLAGVNPYPEYDLPIRHVQTTRTGGYQHQNEGVDFILTRRRGVLSFDPGLGKTWCGIETMELSGCRNVLWVSTKGALSSTRLELKRWGSRITPTLTNYEQLENLVKNWPSGKPAFDMIVWDEASRLRHATTKAWQYAEHLCNSVRTEHSHHIILLMTGTPAPKDPTDWWALIELCAPGWLPEGSPAKLRNTVAVIRPTEVADQRVFNKILAWKDDPNKCNKCGLYRHEHGIEYQLLNNIPAEEFHDFTPSVNEVERLSVRLAPIVMARTKSVLKDLPPQIFQPRYVTPTPQLLAAAELLAATATSAIRTMIMMRELSDGFQYETTVDPIAICVCNGDEQTPPCPHCHGSGVIQREDRKLHEFPTAKDDALGDILEEFSDDGRLIVYAGFQASVDRIARLVQKAGWDYTRLDGRGMVNTLGCKTLDEADTLFQSNDGRKIAAIGHPKSGGMGRTLTASKTTVYFSNDFDLESRLQSKDRNHRIGSKGSLIIDLIHLPVDQMVVDKLNAKQTLMRMSLGEFRTKMEEASAKLAI